MRIEKKYKEEVTKYKIVEVKCDLCGQDLDPKNAWNDDFVLEVATDYSFGPYSGYKDGWKVEDLCEICKRHLRDLLEREGFRISKLDVDW